MRITDYQKWAKTMNYEPKQVDLIIRFAYEAGELQGQIDGLSELLSNKKERI